VCEFKKGGRGVGFVLRAVGVSSFLVGGVAVFTLPPLAINKLFR